MDELTARIGELAEQMDGLAAMLGELAEKVRAVEEMACRDELTGLASQSAYERYKRQLDSEIKGGTASFTLAMMDVNFLKRANDTYGHDAGDALLCDAARVFREVFGEGRVYRLGGDEFMAVVPGGPEVSEGRWAEKIESAIAAFNAGQKAAGSDGRAQFRRPYKSELSVAWGVVAHDPGAYDCFDKLDDEAERRMYECKKMQKSGRPDEAIGRVGELDSLR